EPLQVGAEVYGHAGVESDVEIQALLVSALRAAGVRDPYLDLGHVAVFRSLMRRGEVTGELESELFRALQSKDVPALRELVAPLDAVLRDALLLLPELYGGLPILREARQRLPDFPEIGQALSDMETIAAQLSHVVAVHCFDLAELRGYHYHSGVVFAAYTEGHPTAVALGGRYDEVGQAFGRARPATGFSLDLRELAAFAAPPAPVSAILAPHTPRDESLRQKVEALREQGEVVIVDLPGHAATRAELGCDRRLVQRAGTWKIEKLT
ncbi:MAG TPA: ATP phosphoribosyltransferase regulatory subunit, partial [Burkholderiales bacterium]|nr:ATP phosphoribosyltransferase regulatory subunit [Burkholderiales bacterium]